jgi:hypothetical protein
MKTFDHYFAVVALPQLKESFVPTSHEAEACSQVQGAIDKIEAFNLDKVDLRIPEVYQSCLDNAARSWYFADKKADIYKYHLQLPVEKVFEDEKNEEDN